MDYPRLLKMLRWPTAFLLLTCMATASWAQVQSSGAEERAKLKELTELTLESMGPERIARGAGAVDRAISVLDVSQLRLYTSNFGSQLGRVFRGSSRGSFPNMTGYRRAYWYQSTIALGFDDGPWFSTDMVHESSSFHSSSKVDWEAKDGARGLQFSNPSQFRSGYPMTAHSSLPLTWPTSGWPAPESITEVWDATLSTWNKWERAGDENTYMVFDDKYAGRENDGTSQEMGIEVKERVVAYGAMNLIFIQYEFTNKSSNNYTNVFVGQFADKGSPSTNDGNQSTLIYDNSNSLVYSQSEDFDPSTGLHYRGGGSTSQLTFVGYMVVESPTGSYREDDYDPDDRGIAFIPASQESPMQDLTQAYHPDNILTRVALMDYNDRVKSPDEASLYGALSGDISQMDAGLANEIWKTSWNAGQPILKQVAADYQAYNSGWDTGSTDHFYYSASGPFTFPALSSFDYTVAFVAGQTRDEMEDVAALAKHTFNIQFKGPAAPPAPANFQANGILAGPGGKEYDARMHAYPITYAPSGNITLTWDLAATLTTPDPSSSIDDFEGIRLFRSMDRGDTWGNRITNTEGSFTGWAPYRQWDLDDGIEGSDGLSDTYLGDDSGLVSSFWDENALDGIEYWYAIASYDFGVFDAAGTTQTLRSLQSSYGSSPGAPTVVSVIAGSRPSGYSEGMVDDASSSTATQVAGDLLHGGSVTVNVFNDAQLGNATYRVTTTNSAKYGNASVVSGKVGITLENVTAGTTLFSALLPDDSGYGTNLLPVTDGMSISVNTFFNASTSGARHSGIDWPDSLGGAYGDNWDGYGSNYWGDLDEDELAIAAQYFTAEIRFSTASTQFAYAYDYNSPRAYSDYVEVPFTVWDVTSSPARQVNVAFRAYATDAGGNDVFDFDNNNDPRSVTHVLLSDYSGATPDTMYTTGTRSTIHDLDAAWVAVFVTSSATKGPDDFDGEIVRWNYTRPMYAGMVYEFTSTTPSIDDSLVTLDDIKVVPNPYYIYAEWDLNENRRKIQFTNVPMNSEIQIYTLSGELVAILDHHGDATTVAGGRGYNSNRVGTVDWNIWTYEFTEAAFGLYVYVVKTDDGKTKVGKFAIVR